MTDNEFLKFVRSLIAEYVGEERFWTDEEISYYKQNAMEGVLAEFWTYLAETKKKSVTLSLTAGSPYLSTPSDVLVVMNVIRNEDNEPLAYIRSDEIPWWANYTNEPNYGWTFENNQIKLIPTPTSNKNNFLTLWYFPKLTSLSDFPEALHPLIALDTVIFAKMKDENVGASLLTLRESYRQKAVRFLTLDQFQRP